jgi:hypothetical protein
MISTRTRIAVTILVKAKDRKSIENSSSIFCRRNEGEFDGVLSPISELVGIG